MVSDVDVDGVGVAAVPVGIRDAVSVYGVLAVSLPRTDTISDITNVDVWVGVLAVAVFEMPMVSEWLTSFVSVSA